MTGYARPWREPGWLQQPGLLQTGDYARALIRETGNVPPGEIDDRVATRLARQRLFSWDRPARFSFSLHEFALRLPVGGPAVMVDQLHHLLRMSTRSYLTLRMLPAALGGHAGIAGPRLSRTASSGVPAATARTRVPCVQVAPGPDRVLVRDSKDSHGPALAVPTPAWRAFLTTPTH